MFNFNFIFMKKFFIAALALLTLAACSNESVNDEPGKNGVMTTAELTVKQATSPASRAGDPAPSNDEKKINDLTVYIFNSDKNLEVIADFDLTEMAAMKKTISVTTGQHYFLVAANLPKVVGVKPTMPVIGDLLKDVEEKLMTIVNASLDDITKDASAAHFFMTSQGDIVQKNLEAEVTSGVTPANNKFNLSLGRAMAKVDMNLSSSLVEPNGTLERTGAYKIEYFVANNPKTMYFFPCYSGTQLLTPNYSSTFVNGTAIAGQTDADDYFPKITTADNYTSLAALWNATGAQTYAMENSNVTPAQGETTYILITGQYTPVKWYKWDGAAVVEETGTLPAAGTTFYRIGKKNALGRTESYFDELCYQTLDQTAVDNITSTTSTYSVVEYTNGRCFYNLWLKDKDETTVQGRYTIHRNDFFNITINSINGPGASTPADVIPDPTDPVEVQTTIEATILIMPWNVIEQGGNIG